ncbi:asparagine synthase-related protein [Psychrobacter maritimus]|uniref:asparagine synthase-related protein n=1 Tax=Psychrobacter maritimus TaxID=256325 RepID=UPI001919AE3F|nr:asparagine synthase-related protein [Psychrobacter maritimus]
MQNILSNSYWLESTNKLGGVYPYYNLEEPDSFTLDFSEILSSRKASNLAIELDETALVTKMCIPFLIGDRTLIQGVSKTPWVSNYKGKGRWVPHYLPPHGNLIPEKNAFTIKFKEALLAEARDYIEGKKNIGILLSGGMDSRILAGVIRELQLTDRPEINVVCLTWGASDSRDVVYAQRIAQQFGWEIVHYPLSPETLLRNIKFSGMHGAEFSAFHLHAMEDVANTPNLDAILAGSYGDSVGRAEFSGSHVTKLKPVLPKILDKYGVLNSTSLQTAKRELRNDVIDSAHILQSTSVLRQREIEQEMHYMRRMLQACMQTIAIKTPVYQLFTSPDVFGLMWGLDPEVRNNDWYALLLQQLPGELLNIPWARNGKLYHQQDKPALDNLSKSYHQYGKWLRSDLKQEVLNRLNSDAIRNLSIFNDKGLDRLIKNWEKAITTGINSVDESVVWLCSLHDMIEVYDISRTPISTQNSLVDTVRGCVGDLYATTFIRARNIARK